jgi:hypothetical protein
MLAALQCNAAKQEAKTAPTRERSINIGLTRITLMGAQSPEYKPMGDGKENAHASIPKLKVRLNRLQHTRQCVGPLSDSPVAKIVRYRILAYWFY